MRLIQTVIFAELKRLEIGLSKTNKEINKFENKYKTSSNIFLEQYTAEDLHGKDEEYISWMGELKIRDRILNEVKLLTEIEYVTHRISH